jgi:site-specific DNA recombinase
MSTTVKIKTVVYTRFSPRRNSETCESCEFQAASCEQYAHDHNLDIVATYHDPDVSGGDEYRENLWAAIKKLPKDGVLLVYKRDRLARNVYLSECINRAVRKAGARIIAVEGDIEGDSIEIAMVRQVMAAISEYEKKVIGQRTKWAMAKHQRQGGRMSRWTPYGWKINPDNPAIMLVNDDEQKIIGRMVYMRENGHSMNQIAKLLAENPENVNRIGMPWRPATLWKILKRVTKKL